MKHFGNCAPGEFMAQAMKFRGVFMDWIEAAEASALFGRYADGARAGADERQARRAFVGELLNRGIERCPALTREALCLATFTRPEDFEARPMAEYLGAVFEMASNRVIRDFFTLSLSAGRRPSTGA